MGLLCILLNKDLLVCTLESPGHLLISQNHLELMNKDMSLSRYTRISRASLISKNPLELMNKDMLLSGYTRSSRAYLLISQNHLGLMNKDMFLSGYTSIYRASFDFTKPS
jgi:hypothetical protein